MDLTPEQERLKQAYIKARGYWVDWTEGILRFSPGFLDLYARYGGYAAENGPLSPLMCELIYVALDASSTHLFESGLVLHMRYAMKHGATPAQVMEVLAMATAQGLGGTRVGIDILAEELAAAGKPLPSPAQSDLKSRWLARFGEWPRYAETLLSLDPGYLELVLELNAYADPTDKLSETDRTLIKIALDACFTGLNADALREGIRRAIALGIDTRAILQTLQMTAHLGVHACALGVPALSRIVGESAAAGD